MNPTWRGKFQVIRSLSQLVNANLRGGGQREKQPRAKAWANAGHCRSGGERRGEKGWRGEQAAGPLSSPITGGKLWTELTRNKINQKCWTLATGNERGGQPSAQACPKSLGWELRHKHNTTAALGSTGNQRGVSTVVRVLVRSINVYIAALLICLGCV